MILLQEVGWKSPSIQENRIRIANLQDPGNVILTTVFSESPLDYLGYPDPNYSHKANFDISDDYVVHVRYNQQGSNLVFYHIPSGKTTTEDGLSITSNGGFWSDFSSVRLDRNKVLFLEYEDDSSKRVMACDFKL